GHAAPGRLQRMLGLSHRCQGNRGYLLSGCRVFHPQHLLTTHPLSVYIIRPLCRDYHNASLRDCSMHPDSGAHSTYENSAWADPAPEKRHPLDKRENCVLPASPLRHPHPRQKPPARTLAPRPGYRHISPRRHFLHQHKKGADALWSYWHRWGPESWQRRDRPVCPTGHWETAPHIRQTAAYPLASPEP